MTYFVITNRDGDVVVEPLIKERLERRLDEEYYGSNIQVKKDIGAPDYFDITARLGHEEIIIIKGGLVVPRHKVVVTQHELP